MKSQKACKAIEITPAMIDAGVKFVCEFFPAEWGGVRGISKSEAKAVVEGVLASLLETSVAAPDANNS